MVFEPVPQRIDRSLATSVTLLSTSWAGATVGIPARTLALLLDTANLQLSIDTAEWDWLERSFAYNFDGNGHGSSSKEEDSGSEEFHIDRSKFGRTIKVVFRCSSSISAVCTMMLSTCEPTPRTFVALHTDSSDSTSTQMLT
jgi:hypothetical protein